MVEILENIWKMFVNFPKLIYTFMPHKKLSDINRLNDSPMLGANYQLAC
jgi:hypothetical protein